MEELVAVTRCGCESYVSRCTMISTLRDFSRIRRKCIEFEHLCRFNRDFSELARCQFAMGWKVVVEAPFKLPQLQQDGASTMGNREFI